MVRYSSIFACAVIVLAALSLHACSANNPPPPVAAQLTPQAAAADAAATYERPSRNPFLADSYYPVSHGDAAQSDSTDTAGPMDHTRALSADEIRFTHLGPGSFGAFVSARYPNGRRVMWVSAVNALYKLDEQSYAIIDQVATPVASKYPKPWADALTARLDADNGDGALRTAGDVLRPLRDLSAVYILVGANNWVYVASKDGAISAYGDSVENDPDSHIVLKARFALPPQLAGSTVGMNMTYDGWLILATESGCVIAISRDLKQHYAVRLPGADTEDTRSLGAGDGWVRNSFAIDEAGGIYIASRDHMHKVVWTGHGLSTREADGAWTEPYRNGAGRGTGATPTLMGYGREDRFVVITDGDARMNYTMYWRDAIPAGWTAPAGAPSRRIAGLAPAAVGHPDLKDVQSEQSVAVSGYGAFVVNNAPRNRPLVIPRGGAAIGVLSGVLGSNPRFQPFGVQKFVWDHASRRLFSAWENGAVSSPNAVPWVSRGSNQAYFIGARDNRWTLEALNWTNGAQNFHYVIGAQAYNPTFSGIVLDDQGRATFGSMWGRVRLEPKAAPR